MSRRGALGLARDAWWAASAPTSFFTALHASRAPRLARAAGAATLSALVGLTVLAVAFVRATDSDGFVIAWALATAVALPYLALVVLLGGLVLVRPAALDVRAWELALWSWVPAGVLGASLAPAALVAPVPSAVAGLVALPVWNAVIVASALRAVAPRRAMPALALYLGAVHLVPALLTLVSYAVMSSLRGGA